VIPDSAPLSGSGWTTAHWPDSSGKLAQGDKKKAPLHASIACLVLSLACSQATATTVPTGPTEPTIPLNASPASATTPDPQSRSPILIGTEYILIDNASRIATLAELLAPIGLQMAKPLPENFAWGNMQTAPDAPIDFGRLDVFVKEFQDAGFREFLIALKSGSSWGSKDFSALSSSNLTPKPAHMATYEQWIYSVVERYDADGLEDMPGLLFPVRYYEIGSEFSSYEPEPVEDYLEMLEHAHAAAHRANEAVIVAHAAFLTTLAFADNPDPSEYETAFAGLPDQTHSLADIRQVLDRPDFFDVVNMHSLGDPYEIEAIVSWLNYEMARRGYQKGIIISDTATTPFIGYGPAIACDRDPSLMGRIIPPAAEADRCRLANYFSELLAGDENTLRWTQAFAAEDAVKKVVVSADQGIVLINTAFTEDLSWLKLPLFQAGAGTSAWAGLIDVENREYRASFYALQQLIDHLNGYESITRLALNDNRLRVYEVAQPEKRTWIAWYDPGRLILPDDPVPETTVQLDVGVSIITVEPLVTQFGQSTPNRTVLPTVGVLVTLPLTPTPIFIYREE